MDFRDCYFLVTEILIMFLFFTFMNYVVDYSAGMETGRVAGRVEILRPASQAG